MYCTNCGAQVNDTAVYCSKCGSKIHRAAPAAYEPPAAVEKIGKWTCAKCETVNDGSENCIICGTSYEESVILYKKIEEERQAVVFRQEPPQKAPVIPKKVVPSARPESWVCGSCETLNSAASAVCRTCGKSRPEDILRKPLGTPHSGLTLNRTTKKWLELAVSSVCYIAVIILLFVKWFSFPNAYYNLSYTLFQFRRVLDLNGAHSFIVFVSTVMVILSIVSAVLLGVSILLGLLGRNYYKCALYGKGVAVILAIIAILTVWITNGQSQGTLIELTAVPWFVLFLPIAEDIATRRIFG